MITALPAYVNEYFRMAALSMFCDSFQIKMYARCNFAYILHWEPVVVKWTPVFLSWKAYPSHYNEAFQLNPRNKTLLQKIIVTKLVKMFLAVYRTRMFVIVFTRARRWFRTWDRWFQYTPAHPFPLRSILVVSSHLSLVLLSGLFHSGFITKILYTFHFSTVFTICFALPIFSSYFYKSLLLRI
jgi:hypothetical protein